MAPITSANPGNLVVPLSAIIDRLQGKLSSTDVNALLLAIVGEQKDQVRPGDLITADLINQILAALADLNTRVASLEGGATTPGIRIIRIEGPTPLRVGSRVTAVGENFSVPASRNGIAVDSTPAIPIDNASSASRLVFDMPDPGLGQTGRPVTLTVINADSLSAKLTFQLEPSLNVPSGTLALNYVNPPANAGDGNLHDGTYEFGFKLLAAVDQDSYIRLGAESSANGWTSKVVNPLTGAEITDPVPLLRSLGTHFERNFLVQVKVPSAGAAAATIDVTAREVTPSTRVSPALPHTLTLALGQQIPVPETRVTVDLLNTSQNVAFDGGSAVFTRNQPGQIDFEILFSALGTASAVTTNFALTAQLDPPVSGWQLGPLSQGGASITGPNGTGRTSALVQPPNAASNVALLLTISGTPAGQNPITNLLTIIWTVAL